MIHDDFRFGTKLDNDGLYDVADLWDNFIIKNPSNRTASVVNPYHTLEINPNATPEEIKTAYKSLARRLHPDVNSDHDAAERFRDIKEAYDMLTPGTPFTAQDDAFGFINQNSRNSRCITREELESVLSGNPIDENRFFSHIRRCDRCYNIYLNAKDRIDRKHRKHQGFFGKAKEKFQEFVG